MEKKTIIFIATLVMITIILFIIALKEPVTSKPVENINGVTKEELCNDALAGAIQSSKGEVTRIKQFCN